MPTIGEFEDAVEDLAKAFDRLDDITTWRYDEEDEADQLRTIGQNSIAIIKKYLIAKNTEAE